MSTQDQKTILLVEDEALIAMVVAKTIKQFGYQVIIAHSGEKAVKLAAENRDISLIIMDINLGKGIDGTEAARQILSTRTLPIVFLTSHSEKEYVDRVKEITRYGYVIKGSGDFVLQSSIDMAFELFESHEKMKTSEIKYRRLHETMMDAFVFVDMTGNILEVNQSFTNMLGYSVEELQQLTYLDITPEKWHPLEAKIVSEQIMVRGFSDIYEKEYICKDGIILPVELRVFLVNYDEGLPSGLWAIVRDTTDRKKAEAQISSSAQLLQDIIDHSQYLVYAKNFEGQFVLASRSLADFFGYPREYLFGKTSHDFLPKAIADQHRANDLKIMERQSLLRFEETAEARDGIRTFLSTKFPLFDTEGKMYAVCGASVDITDQKRIEEDLRIHQIELTMQNEELRHAQQELQTSRARYFDMYDQAPVGFCTLSENGLILEANLTVAALLGVTRNILVKQPLSRFILPEDQDIYYRFRACLRETNVPRICELRMVRGDDTPFQVHLWATETKVINDTPLCLLTVIDFTAHAAREGLR